MTGQGGKEAYTPPSKPAISRTVLGGSRGGEGKSEARRMIGTFITREGEGKELQKVVLNKDRITT